jgi:hypothetical protein
LFFQPEQYFSLTTNQSIVFFSRLISTAERGLIPFHTDFMGEKEFTPISCFLLGLSIIELAMPDSSTYGLVLYQVMEKEGWQ